MTDLDRWSAEVLMGWTQIAGDKIGKWFRIGHIESPVYIMEIKDWHPSDPTTGQIWLVVERMHQKGIWLRQCDFNPYTKNWIARFVSLKLNEASCDPNPAQAILLAANAALDLCGSSKLS